MDDPKVLVHGVFPERYQYRKGPTPESFFVGRRFYVIPLKRHTRHPAGHLQHCRFLGFSSAVGERHTSLASRIRRGVNVERNPRGDDDKSTGGHRHPYRHDCRRHRSGGYHHGGGCAPVVEG